MTSGTLHELGQFAWGGLRRTLYSLAISAGIVSAVFAVLAGGVCKPTATFDFYGSLAAPASMFTTGYFIAYPALLVVALIALPFTRSNGWSRRRLLVLILVPLGIYAIFGGLFALSLYYYPVSGCF